MNTETDTASKPTIHRRERYHFEISSRTRPDLRHTVDVLRLRCSCEAGRYGRRCWHIVWALQAEQWLDRAADEQRAREREARP